VRRVVAGRAVRGLADGFVSVLLAQYLTDRGFSPLQVGAVVTGTLIGSAALTLAFGLRAHRTTLGRLLVAACVLMALTGLGFALATSFALLLVVAVIGTLNPSAGDVSVFLPTEQAFLANRVAAPDRTRMFARYNLGAVFAGAIGALLSAAPARVHRATGWSLVSVERAGFGLYTLAALGILALYLPLGRSASKVARAGTEPDHGEADHGEAEGGQPRRKAWTDPRSRRTAIGLAGLFTLDSAGSGFVVTSLLVLWLHLRFGLGAGSLASVFFAAGLLGAGSQLLAPVLARRIGLVRTMVFTHIPANILLAAAAFAPNAAVAVGLLLVRALFAQMDVPARQAFVMSVVPAADRAAAASVTNVPRSLASATTPLLAGALLARTTFGWPLLIAGTTKLAYDLLLLYRHHATPESVAT
jgi:MFS family permease